MDRKDERILELLQGNARMSYQELGDALGMSRVAAKKRGAKLEEAEIIRGYNTCVYRDEDITMFIDIVTHPEAFEDVLEYVGTQTAYIRQIFTTTMKYHIHIVAVSDSVSDLKYLTNMIQKHCAEQIKSIQCHAVKEIIKDVYGGVRYEQSRGKKM